MAGNVFFFFDAPLQDVGYRMCCSRFSETNKGEFLIGEQRNMFACIHFIWPRFQKVKRKGNYLKET